MKIHYATSAIKYLKPLWACSLLMLFLSISSYAQVSGTVFKDFNANGTKDITPTYNEVGMIGVVVNATNPAGAALTVTYTGGGASTNITGGYSVPSGTAGQIRLEFVMPDSYTFASSGNTGGTTVMFPSGATQNLAVNYPQDYSQANPQLVVPCYVGQEITGPFATEAAMARFNYYGSSGPILKPTDPDFALYPYTGMPTKVTDHQHLGGTYGVAYNRITKRIFAGAVLHRHVAYGPLGIGGIYEIDPLTGTVNNWLDIESLAGVDAGTDTRDGTTLNSLALEKNYDYASFALVGKTSLGDVEISDDGKVLYVINVFQQSLVAINTNTKALIGSYSIPVPAGLTCPLSDFRPWGLKYYKGKLYVGAVCTAQTSQLPADLKAYVLQFDPANPGAGFSTYFSFPLNYTREMDDWHPWNQTSFEPSGSTARNSQPIFSDIEFDVDGSLIMGFLDRHVMMFSSGNYPPDPAGNSTATVTPFPNGDMLRACMTSTGLVLEGGAGCSFNPPATGSSAEFYDDRRNGPANGNIKESTGGSLALLPGSTEVVGTTIDNQATDENGVGWWNNTNGVRNRAYMLTNKSRDEGGQGKTSGLGDIELLSDAAPIEIGNRVWDDMDADGVQDAGEPALGGVTVTLCDAAGTPIPGATATTDPNGNYYFSTATGTNSTSAIYGLNLSFGTAYILKFPTTSGTKSLSTKDLGGNDLVDSDAGTDGKITFTTGYAGENNHSFDVGYSTSTCIKPYAGADQSPTCVGTTPITTATLAATAVSGGAWTQLGTSPNTATITASSSATSTVTGLVPGVYQFIWATSATCSDTVKITIPSCSVPTGPTPICPTNQISNYSFENGTTNVTTTIAGSSATLNVRGQYGVGTDNIVTDDGAGVSYWINASSNGGTGSINGSYLVWFGTPASGNTNKCISDPFVRYAFTANTCYSICYKVAAFDPNNLSAGSTALIELGPAAAGWSPTFSAGGSVAYSDQYAYGVQWSLPAPSAPKDINGNPYTGAVGQVLDWKTLNWQTVCINITPTVTGTLDPIYFSTKGDPSTSITKGIAIDDISVCTGCAVACIKPYAGADQSPTCVGTTPITTATLAATAVSGGAWTQLGTSPNTATITASSSATSTVTGLVPGVYQFIWATATTCSDTVKITIPNCTCSKPDAGVLQNLTCSGTSPITTATLAATPVSGGGWSQAATNPAGAVITNAASASSGLTGLNPGVYQFIWGVSATCSDTVKIVVPNCQSVAPCTPDAFAYWGFEDCSPGSNTPNDGMAPTATKLSGCSNVTVSELTRNNSGNSCQTRPNGSTAICMGSATDINFVDNSDKAIMFSLSFPAGSLGKLSSINFETMVPKFVDFNNSGDQSNLNNYPTLWGIRVLKDNVEIFKLIDQPLTLDVFTTNNLDWSTNAAFDINGATTFKFEIMGYRPSNVSGAGIREIWDLDELKVFGYCGNCAVCTKPTLGATVTTNAGTCTNTTPNNNATAILAVTGGDKADIVEGATYGSGPAYGAGTNVSVSAGNVSFSNLKHNTQYTIRVWNAGNTCYEDKTFITATITCSCTSPVLTDLTNQAICEGGTFTTANVTTSVSNGVTVTYQWYNDNGTANQNTDPISGQTTAVLTALPTAVGVYKYRVEATNTADNTCKASKLVTLTIVAPANAGTDGSISVCDNSTTAIDLFSLITGEATGGVWTRTTGTGGNFDATAGTFTPASGASSSTFTYTITGTAPCVDDASVATVNISTYKTAGTDGNTSVCDNSTTAIDLFSLITGEATGGVWTRTTGTGGNFDATAGTFTPASGASSSTFTYTITGTAPCANDASVATVNISAFKSAGTDGNTSVCDNSTTAIDLFSLITGEASGGVWTRTTGTGGTFNATAGTFTPASGASSSTFTYTITGTAPCVDDASVATVNISAFKSAGTDGVAATCDNRTTPINLFSLITGEVTGGVWTRTSGTGGTFNATAGTFTPAPGASSSTFTYTVTGTAPCPDDASIATVNITPQPTVNAGLDQNICAGEKVTLAGTVGGSASNGTWSGGSGSFAPEATLYLSNLKTIVYTPSLTDIANGTVTLTLTTDTPAGPCVAAIDQMVITISPRPVANATVKTQAICLGGVVAAFNATPSTGVQYKWYGPLADTTTSLGSAISAQTNAAFTPTGSVLTTTGRKYFAVVVNNINNVNCADTAFVALVINPKPVVTPAALSVCENIPGSGLGTFNLSSLNNTVGGSNSVTWFSNAARTTAINAPAAFVSPSGKAYVVVTNPNTACSDTTSATLTVFGKPTNINAQTSCTATSNGSGKIVVTATAPAASSLEYKLDASGTYASSATFNGVSNGSHTVYVRVVGTLCYDSTIVNLNCFCTQPTLAVVDPTAVCAPMTVNINSSSVITTNTGTRTNFWKNANLTQPLDATSGPASAIKVSGTYYIKTMLADSSCYTAKAVSVVINPLPVVKDTILTLCDLGTGKAVFNLSAINATVNAMTNNAVAWFSDAARSAAIPNPSAYLSGNTRVYVRVTNTTTNCSDTTSVRLSLKAKPNAGADVMGVNAICTNVGTVTLTATPSGGVWAQLGSSPSVASVSNQGVVTGLSELGTYQFTYSLNGCIDTVAVETKNCAKGSLGDFVWKDTNNNGIQDETTPNGGGVAGVQIELYKNGTLFAKDTTDATGKYLFTNLDAGTYKIKVLSVSLPAGCEISSVKDAPSDDAKDSDVDKTTGESGNYEINPLDPTKKDILTVDAALVVPCVKSQVTLTGAPVCSADIQTYSITFSVTGKNGIIKVNKGTLTGANPYTVTGIPSGATIKITDSLSAVCKFDTLITGPNCNCNPPLPILIAGSVTACAGDTFPTLKATVVGLATVEWFTQATGGTAIFTGVNYKPSGAIPTTGAVFYAQARSTDPTCPTAISTSRVMATINAQDCTKEVDLALKKSINTKIAQIGDVLTYTLKVWNESNTNATGVEVTDSIATTVQFQAGSFVSSRGTATITGNVIKWTIGNIASNGDTVTLTYRVKATQQGVHFNTAEISKTNEKDKDSTPGNGKDSEDDIDHQCFTVPIKLCTGSKVEVSVSTKYTNVQWFKDGGSTPIASGNVVLLSGVGIYTYTASNQTCPAGGCCPVIIEDSNNCCPVEKCVPVTIRKIK